MRKIDILVICTIVLLCMPFTPTARNADQAAESTFNESNLSQMLSNPVIITSDSQMLSAGFDGDGSAGNPFRIFSLFITTDGTYGIWISNVNYYFDIWDCLITGSPHLGIGIRDCLYANISDTTVMNTEYGIQIEDTPNAVVDNCIVTPEAEGIGLSLDGVTIGIVTQSTITGGNPGCLVSDSAITFVGNNFIDCVNGIKSPEESPASNCVVISNHFENCSGYGIRLEDNTPAFSIIGNTFRGFYTGGVVIFYSRNMINQANNFTHCGLTVIGSGLQHYDHSVEDNLVNSKPLLYLNNVDDVHYTGGDYGQIYLISCDGITIRDGLITSTQRGVFIAYSSNCVVRDMMITACQVGVNIDDSEFITVTNCTIRSCSWGVLFFSNARNNFILNNQICYSFGYGVLLNPSSSLNVLVNNSFYYNDDLLKDDGDNNMWDDGHQFGNIYDDYVGYGNYTISGSAGAVDHYPRRYVPTSSGGIEIPFEVTATAGLALSAIAIVLALIYLKRVWKRTDF